MFVTFQTEKLPRLGTVEVAARVTLGRPAPACSNPDSPAFADSGDPAETEILDARAVDDDGNEVALLGTTFTPGVLTDAELALLEQAALDEAEAQHSGIGEER